MTDWKVVDKPGNLTHIYKGFYLDEKSEITPKQRNFVIKSALKFKIESFYQIISESFMFMNDFKEEYRALVMKSFTELFATGEISVYDIAALSALIYTAKNRMMTEMAKNVSNSLEKALKKVQQDQQENSSTSGSGDKKEWIQ